MSISIGIYDLFAYTIPGLLYMYAIYEFLWRVGAIQFEFSDIPDISSGTSLLVVGVVVVGAHLVGHLLDFFTLRFTSQVIHRHNTFETYLQSVKESNPEININFKPKDWNLLLTMLRQRNHELSQLIDTYGAYSIMMRNICFGLYLLSLLTIYTLIVSFSYPTLIIIFGLLLFCYISFKRSKMFQRWFLTSVFEASLDYGNNLKEVVEYNRSKKTTPKRTKSKS